MPQAYSTASILYSHRPKCHLSSGYGSHRDGSHRVLDRLSAAPNGPRRTVRTAPHPALRGAAAPLTAPHAAPVRGLRPRHNIHPCTLERAPPFLALAGRPPRPLPRPRPLVAAAIGRSGAAGSAILMRRDGTDVLGFLAVATAGAGASCAERLTLVMVFGLSVGGQYGAANNPSLIAINCECKHHE